MPRGPESAYSRRDDDDDDFHLTVINLYFCSVLTQQAEAEEEKFSGGDAKFFFCDNSKVEL